MRKQISNPFAYYPAWKLVGIGLIALLAGSLTGWYGAARYDGVLDLHFGPSVGTWQPLLDNLVNIGSLFMPLAVFGFTINRKTRFIDILSTVLMARIPYYVLPLFNVSGYVYRSSTKLIAGTQHGAPIDGDVIIANIVFISLAITATVLFILWLFSGFQTATNCKKTAHRWIFAGCILLAEVISKLCIYFFKY